MTKPHFETRIQKALTLVGSLIIFATFIVKEGIGDNLKDVVSGIESAKTRFQLRDDISHALVPQPKAMAGRTPSAEELKQYILSADDQIRLLLPLFDELSQSLPNTVNAKERGEALNSVEADVVAALAAVPRAPADDRLAAMKAVWERSSKNWLTGIILERDLLDEADRLRTKLQHRYDIAKWSSYGLFTLGWVLAFCCKLWSGGDDSGNEEAM